VHVIDVSDVCDCCHVQLETVNKQLCCFMDELVEGRRPRCDERGVCYIPPHIGWVQYIVLAWTPEASITVIRTTCVLLYVGHRHLKCHSHSWGCRVFIQHNCTGQLLRCEINAISPVARSSLRVRHWCSNLTCNSFSDVCEWMQRNFSKLFLLMCHFFIINCAKFFRWVPT